MRICRERAAQSSARDGCLHQSSNPEHSIARIPQTCGEKIGGLVGSLTPSWSGCSRGIIRSHIDRGRGQQRPMVRPLLAMTWRDEDHWVREVQTGCDSPDQPGSMEETWYRIGPVRQWHEG